MTDYRQIVRRLELDLYKAEHGMGMPYDRERVIALRDQIAGYRKLAELELDARWLDDDGEELAWIKSVADRI